MSKKEKKVKVKKPSWWQEFKDFAIKGNAMALAVGTIIGAAFKTITDSLTKDVIMPIVNIFLGGTDFTELKVELPRITPVYEEVLNETTGVMEKVEVPNYLTYGNFIEAVINFFILALVVFWLVKFLNRLSELGKKKEEEEAAAAAAAAEAAAVVEPEPTKEEVLLAEIRDLLKDKN